MPYRYWSGTQYHNPDGPSPYAWIFRFDARAGAQEYDNRSEFYYAWAVRDGDVAPVPEPSTMILFFTSLVGFAGFRKYFWK